MTVLVLLTGLCVVIGFGLTITALVANRHSPLNRAVALNGFFLGLWALGTFFQSYSVNQDEIWFWYRFSTIGSALNAPSALWYFLSLADLGFRKKVFTIFPFYLIAVVMIVANFGFHVWYSGFQLTPMGPVGLAINPTAWVAFYLQVAIYIWAYLYFCSTSGFGSQRLAWLTRTFRNVLLAAIFFYLASLVAEVVFLLPHISGLSYGAVAGFWFYQTFRYGLLSRNTSRQNLDLLLALKTPAAYLWLDGSLARANEPFVRLLGLEGRDLATLRLSELVTEPGDLDSIRQQFAQGQQELILNGLKTVNGRTHQLVLSPDRDRFGDVVGIILQVVRNDDLARRLDGFGLTEREVNVAILMGQGLSYQEIADRSFISPGTVRVHCHHIFEKVGVGGRAELVRLLTSE